MAGMAGRGPGSEGKREGASSRGMALVRSQKYFASISYFLSRLALKPLKKRYIIHCKWIREHAFKISDA